MHQRIIFALITVYLSASVLPADEAAVEESEPEYGHLRGRFVYDGDPPAPRQFAARMRGAAMVLTDESLLVNEENQGVANVCVWLDLRRGQKLPPMHPSYVLDEDMEKDKRSQTLTARRGRFEPHILTLRTDELLNIRNVGRIAHAPRVDARQAPLGRAIPPGPEFIEQFKKPERMPVPVNCGVHPWMRGWVILKDHPYMAVSDENGAFEIRNIPVGEWTFQFWHETAGYIREVEIDGEESEWSRGRAKFRIGPMPTDLGDVLLAPELFGS